MYGDKWCTAKPLFYTEVFAVTVALNCPLCLQATLYKVKAEAVAHKAEVLFKPQKFKSPLVTT